MSNGYVKYLFIEIDGLEYIFVSSQALTVWDRVQQTEGPHRLSTKMFREAQGGG